MKNYGLTSIPIVLSLFLSGCPKPSVDISVQPDLLCKKGEVTVTWKVSRIGDYDVVPNIGNFTTVIDGDSGSKKVTVDVTTKFMITGQASNGLKQDSATVFVGRSGLILNLQLLRVSCGNGRATYRASVKAGGPGFPQSFVKNEVVTKVVNVNNREVLISFHMSKPVAANSSTTIFNGYSPEGTWTVSTQLKPGEVCSPGTVGPDPNVIPAPGTLMLKIFYGCTP